MSYIETKDNARTAVNASLDAVRKALADGNLDAYNTEMTTLASRVKELNSAIANVEYEKLAAEPAPIIAAVQKFYIDVCTVDEKRDKETGSVTSVSLKEDKKKQIDLEKFCKVAGLSTEWATNACKLLDLLTLREVNVFTMSAGDLAKKSFYFIAQATKKAEGETPDSNRQLVMLIQSIIDGAIFVDDGNGKNRYKCTNHDIAFIHDAATALNRKEKCSIAMVSPSRMKEIMMSVFAHCLGTAYTVKTNKKS